MRPTILALILAAALRAWIPTKADLETDMKAAGAAWGMHADVRSIGFLPLTDCAGIKGIRCAGWSELVARRIYISSSFGPWTPQLLLIAVEHEYGHMLMGSAHSLDQRSVMYYAIREGQRILPEDIEWANRLRERPTLKLEK
jgi:hypothetical protein